MRRDLVSTRSGACEGLPLWLAKEIFTTPPVTTTSAVAGSQPHLGRSRLHRTLHWWLVGFVVKLVIGGARCE